MIPRLGGYHYEVNVCVLRIIDLLGGKIEKILLEKAQNSDDIFDDMKVFQNTTVHHFQVKWGMKKQSTIKLSDFVNESSDLYLLKLFRFWESLQESSTSSHTLHVFSSKNIEKNNLIKKYLENTDSDKTLFSHNSEAFHFSISLWNEDKFKSINQALTAKSISKEVFSKFLKSLILEFDQPTFVASENFEKEYGNPIKQLVLNKISNELGLDKPPNSKDPQVWYDSFIRICYESIVQGTAITKNHIVEKLGIITDLKPIKQEFPFDEENYIKTEKSYKELSDYFCKISEGMITVVGSPGSGKSHLLTYWSKSFEDTKIKPIVYYCFIKDLFDEKSRISENQLIQNLIFDILANYSFLGKTSEYPILGATQERLEKLLERLGKFANENNITIPFIVDGLDHIARILKTKSFIPFDDGNILEFFLKLKIPKGIILILGTQPGEHFDNLQEKLNIENIIHVEGFSNNESEKYLSQYDITSEKVPLQLIKQAIEKTKGNPLLLAYSIQANNNLTDKERKEFFENFISNLPNTIENVNEYYNILWDSCSSAPISRQFAQLLSIIDFPATNEFLEKIIPSEERSFEDKEKYLKIISPVLKQSSEGITIFHDSFSTFIREHSDFNPEMKIYYYKKLFKHFENIGFYANELAFSKSIEYGFYSESFEGIQQIVDLRFIDNAFLQFMPFESILTNIDFAINASIKTKNIPNLVCLCILRKYSQERFEFNLPIYELAEILIILGRTDLVSRLIYPNKTFNLDLNSTISLLALSLEHGIILPYKDIMKKWFFRIKFESEDNQKIHNPENFAMLLTSVFGLEKAMKWVNVNLEEGHEVSEKILEKIGRNCSSEEIKSLESEKIDLQKSIVVINNHLQYGNRDLAKEKLIKIFSEKISPSRYILTMAMELNIDPKLLTPFIEQFEPSPPKNFVYDEEIEILRDIEFHSTLLTYCSKNEDLDQLFSKIQESQKTSARLLRELMFKLSTTKTKMKIENTDESTAQILIESFTEFISFATPPGIFPRDGDCTHLNEIANHILSEIISTYLKLKTDPDIEGLIKLILKLDNKFHWQSNMGFDWIFISTEHAVNCLSKLIEKYPKNVELKEKISKIVESFPLPGYTGSRVTHLLENVRIYQKCNLIDKAKESLNTAILTSHAYGYRKDLLLDELHSISIFLNSTDSRNAEKRASDILDLSEYLWIVTDHKETQYIPGYVLEELLRIHSSSSIELIKRLQDEKFILPIKQGYEYIIDNYLETNVFDRFRLIKKLENEFEDSYNENPYFSSRFNLLEHAISLNDVKSGEKILEDTRELLIRAEHPKEEWQKKFNNFADRLNKDQIDISSKIVKSEIEKILEDKGSSIIFEDGTIDEICEQFRKIEKKDRWDVTKQFAKLLKPKISELDLEGLKKLEGFYSEVEDSLIPPIEILQAMANQYRKFDSEKYVTLTLKTFGKRYWSWQGYMMENRIRWLVELYNFNNDSIGEILESFGKYNQEGYGPGGSIKRLGEFLQLTNQIKVLNETYSRMFDLCTTFFRNYEKTGIDYGWMKNKDFEKISEDEILEKILEC